MLRISDLRRAMRRPGLFEGDGELYWNDPLISDKILAAHLDPTSDDASRRPATVAKSAAWIASQAGTGRRLLDLGCGPGLYCEELVRLGFEVTGLDLSERSIEYARSSAADGALSIRYEVADYRAIDYRSRFDVITLIYGGFCCLSDADRDDLLLRVRRALAPGGVFVFDAFSSAYIDRAPGSTYLKLRGGFWRAGAHLVMERSFDYDEDAVHLDRFVVIDAGSGVAVYDLWKHYYARETLEPVLASAGFSVRGWYRDLCGGPFRPEGPWFGIVAAPITVLSAGASSGR